MSSLPSPAFGAFAPERGTTNRLLSPRQVAVLTPAILLAEPGSTAAGLPALLGRRDWPTSTFDDITRAAHHASVRDTRLVLIGGDTYAYVLTAVRALRAGGDFPIAVLGGAWSPDQVLALLEAGANLLIEKLTDPREVVARLTALCRSVRGDDALQVRWLHASELKIDLGSRRVLLGEERITLSQNEFDLLAFLMARAEQMVSTQEIIQGVWNWRHGDGLNTLRIHVGRLRKKLRDSTAKPHWIASSRGLGYQFLQPVAEIGEDRSEDRLRRTLSTLNAQGDALYAIVDSLLAADGAEEVAETVVQWAVGRNFCDAATVFKLENDASETAMSRLIASSGMSSRWRQALATGHPVKDGFIAAHAYSSGEIVQLSDVTKLAKRFPVTASMSSAEDLHACLLFPLFVDGVIWGDLAFVSRTARAFNPARTAYLRSVAGLVSLALSANGENGANGQRGDDAPAEVQDA
jgi:DNA-binding response OmpR family regulator